jgi:hypothetical protein
MNVLPSRRYDVRASTLLFADFALGHFGTFLAHQGMYAPAPSAAAVGIGLSTAALMLALIACVRKGYRWAKILYAALFAFGLLTLPLTYRALLATNWSMVRYGTHFFVQFVGCLLLLEGHRADKRAVKPLG